MKVYSWGARSYMFISYRFGVLPGPQDPGLYWQLPGAPPEPQGDPDPGFESGQDPLFNLSYCRLSTPASSHALAPLPYILLETVVAQLCFTGSR